MNDMLRTLTRRSFVSSRLRNVIAVLAIAITAVLFTSVTTIMFGTIQSITLMMQMQKGSKSDGEFRNMTAAQFEMMKESELIKQAGLRMPVGFLENTNRHNVEFDVMDKVQAELTFCFPSHGTMPQKANEVVASDRALRDLGADAEVGEELIIAFTAHGQAYHLPVIVSGWYESPHDQMSMMWAGTSFRDAYPEIFEYTYDKDGASAGTYYSDFLATSTIGLEQNIENLSRSLGGNPDDIEAANFLPAVVNQTTHQKTNIEMTVIAMVFVALFMFCGYLLIYNVFDIAVMQQIRRYGLYRTIGMSKRQVKHLMNCQTVWLSGIGTPIGLLIGFLIGKAVMPIVMHTFVNEYSNIPVKVTPSPVIFAGAAFFTAFVVWISTKKPVKKAVNISPVEAFHYVETSTGKCKERRSAFGASLSKLAWSNLGRNKRRSVFIIISLMLCIILLNCAGTAAGSVDVEKMTDYMIRTDFAVVNAVSMNVMEGFTSRTEALKEETIEEIAAQPGVKDAATVYKNTLEDTNVTYQFDYVSMLGDKAFITERDEYASISRLHDGEGRAFGIGDDKRPVCNVYGMEEVSIARMDLREGETNPAILYQKMLNGEGILVGVNVNRADMSLNDFLDVIHVGEEIQIYKNGQLVKELPVLAKAAVNGDDVEIGTSCNGMIKVGGDGPLLYLPSSIYCQLYDEPAIYKYSFNVEKENQADMVAFLEHYMQNIDTSINYLSAESACESAVSMRSLIQFVGGLIGSIFGIAGILNFINMIITTVLTRRREFATMQSIGMTTAQLTRMMIYESLYYAGGACMLGLVGAVLASVILVKGAVRSIWYFTFRFTFVPAIGVCAVFIILAAIIPVVSLKAFHKDSIVEQLRIAE